jgi:hypothetical protein
LYPHDTIDPARRIEREVEVGGKERGVLLAHLLQRRIEDGLDVVGGVVGVSEAAQRQHDR